MLYSLTSNGDLVVLDEPFTFLNEEEAEDLTRILHIGREAGKSIVMATHNIEWIEENASTMELFSKEGNIWARGSIQYFQKGEFRAERCPYLTYEI